ncbi:MAG: hypothetical protein PHW96_04400, partial [Candidatus Nanoarchaeia archaeon]|nr:hypothetical protein [Candidatus Nanoarchaeia archaeon]
MAVNTFWYVISIGLGAIVFATIAFLFIGSSEFAKEFGERTSEFLPQALSIQSAKCLLNCYTHFKGEENYPLAYSLPHSDCPKYVLINGSRLAQNPLCSKNIVALTPFSNYRTGSADFVYYGGYYGAISNSSVAVGYFPCSYDMLVFTTAVYSYVQTILSGVVKTNIYVYEKEPFPPALLDENVFVEVLMKTCLEGNEKVYPDVSGTGITITISCSERVISSRSEPFKFSDLCSALPYLRNFDYFLCDSTTLSKYSMNNIYLKDRKGEDIQNGFQTFVYGIISNYTYTQCFSEPSKYPEDYQPVSDTLKTKTGRCDDFAVFAYSAMRSIDARPENLELT